MVANEIELTREQHSRLLALVLLCAGVMMVVIDSTIVTVALPSILRDLHLSSTSSTWVLNAYLLAFGGFLLVSGRLGDLHGQRRLYPVGMSLFVLASLACGLAPSAPLLIGARAAQGLGGAVVSAVSLALILSLFTEPRDRARALGGYGFVCAIGGCLGELLGGLLTSALGWHWIFLINVPIGIAVCIGSLYLLAPDSKADNAQKVGFTGPVAMTAALASFTYAVIGANRNGWVSALTLGSFATAAVLLSAFVVVERRSLEPLIPLRIFDSRNLTVATLIAALWSAGTFTWFVVSALYLQQILSYEPLQVGLAFLPADLVTAVFSAGLSATVVMRFGVLTPLWSGLLLSAAGLVLLARVPVAGTFTVDVLPGMLLLGIGSGFTTSPLLLAAMRDVSAKDSGLASGIVNSALLLGGAVGVAVLISLGEARTNSLLNGGRPSLVSISGGYQIAFLGAALSTAIAAGLGALSLKR